MMITEALAELKTLQKRIEKKREQVMPYVLRRAVVVDPLAESGGSKEFVRRERQALADLEERFVKIRVAIQDVNLHTNITISTGESTQVTRTVASWLAWRKEVADGQQRFLGQLRTSILRARDEYAKKGGVTAESAAAVDPNVIVNVDEAQLLKENEAINELLSVLDGKLSLMNATTIVNV